MIIVKEFRRLQIVIYEYFYGYFTDIILILILITLLQLTYTLIKKQYERETINKYYDEIRTNIPFRNTTIYFSLRGSYDRIDSIGSLSLYLYIFAPHTQYPFCLDYTATTLEII